MTSLSLRVLTGLLCTLAMQSATIAQAPAYEQRADLLGPGERLILHTDGVLDAHAPQVILSSADLAARAATPGGAEEVADALLAHVTQSAVPARDDCAVLVLAQKP